MRSVAVGVHLGAYWLVLCATLAWGQPSPRSHTKANDVTRARELRKSGDLDGAMALLRRVLDQNPHLADAQTELGLCHWAMNNLGAAQACFEKAIELDPAPLTPWLNLAEVLSERNDFSQARNVLRWTSMSHPERAEPHYLLAKIRFRAGRLGGAERSAKQALQHDHSRVPEVHILLANIFLARGKQAEMVEQLEAYLVEAPQGEQAERARTSLERVRAETKGIAAPSVTPYWNLVDLYKSGRFIEAASALSGLSRRTIQESIDARNPRPLSDSQLLAATLLHTESALVMGNESSFHFRRAVEYLGRIKNDERRKALERQWFLALGYYYLGKYRFMVALPFLVDGMKRFPEDLEIRLALGSAGEGAGLIRGHASELHRAETQFRYILERDTEHVEAQLRLGHVLRLMGKDDEALRHLTWILEHSDRQDALLLTHLVIGHIHQQRRHLDRAIDSYEAAVAIDPSCQTAATALSHALHYRGDVLDSREVLRRFLERNGNSAGAEDAWWRYLCGHAERFDPMLRQMRKEVQQ